MTTSELKKIVDDSTYVSNTFPIKVGAPIEYVSNLHEVIGKLCKATIVARFKRGEEYFWMYLNYELLKKHNDIVYDKVESYAILFGEVEPLLYGEEKYPAVLALGAKYHDVKYITMVTSENNDNNIVIKHAPLGSIDCPNRAVSMPSFIRRYYMEVKNKQPVESIIFPGIVSGIIINKDPQEELKFETIEPKQKSTMEQIADSIREGVFPKKVEENG